MNNPQELKIEPFFGGFVLETLTVGMYGESRNAIREYIQNGFDSIQKATKTRLLDDDEGLIKIEMGEDKDSLVIRDNGTGISEKNANSILTRVGASTKDSKSSAGFRGIGRLAGIGFSNTVTFTTKAQGEKLTTTVCFHGDRMRELMNPSKGSGISAEELLRKCVDASVAESDDEAEHFFKVELKGFSDAPEECTSFELMRDFVSQVAPVGYHSSFPFKKQLEEAANECDLPIEEVRVTLKNGLLPAVDITKVYKDAYRLDSGDIKLSECVTYVSDDKNWWAWYGKKVESGSYTDSRVSGLRVRMKNIQIDGTDVIRDIFMKRAKSHARFQDWSVGEVFVRSSFLVPNARRDGFEETPDWKAMRKALTNEVIEGLGTDSYKISSAGQMSIPALSEKVKEKFDDLEQLKRTGFKNVDKVLELSVAVTKIQKKIAAASKNADLSILADLQALSSELIDIKSEAVGAIKQPDPVDLDAAQQDARDELLLQLLILFENELQPGCFIAVRNLLQAEYGVSGN